MIREEIDHAANWLCWMAYDPHSMTLLRKRDLIIEFMMLVNLAPRRFIILIRLVFGRKPQMSPLNTVITIIVLGNVSVRVPSQTMMYQKLCRDLVRTVFRRIISVSPHQASLYIRIIFDLTPWHAS